MDPFQRFDNAYRRLISEGLPLLHLGTEEQVELMQAHYTVTKEAARIVTDLRAPPQDDSLIDDSIPRRLKDTFAATGSTNPPPGWNAQSTVYATLLLRDFIPAYEGVLDADWGSPQEADFIASPTSLVQMATGRI